MPITLPLSRQQQILCDTYAQGDYFDLVESAQTDTLEKFEERVANIGDTLFRFLLVELDPSEDCEGPVDGSKRCVLAIEEIEVVAAALARVG